LEVSGEAAATLRAGFGRSSPRMTGKPWAIRDRHNRTGALPERRKL